MTFSKSFPDTSRALFKSARSEPARAAPFKNFLHSRYVTSVPGFQNASSAEKTPRIAPMSLLHLSGPGETNQ